MKKLFQTLLMLLVFILAVSSCSTIKKLPATVAGASRARFVGKWTLANVSYDGLIPGSVQTIFDQASPEAFNGSVWNLTNSGDGIYSLANGSSQTIFWSYNTSDGGSIFQFKKIYQGDNARKIQDGYQLQVSNIDDTQMTLKLPVSLGDKTAYVILFFNKQQ